MAEDKHTYEVTLQGPTTRTVEAEKVDIHGRAPVYVFMNREQGNWRTAHSFPVQVVKSIVRRDEE